MKQIVITISADISDDQDVEHDAIVSTREPVKAVVEAMAKHGLTATVKSKVTRPKGPRQHRGADSADSADPQQIAAEVTEEMAQAAE